jgi:acetolactate synthase-1/2/3 large subunit
MTNPNFVMLANSYGIPAEDVETRDQLDEAIQRMVSHNGSYLIDVNINPEEMVYPMTPPGGVVDNIMLSNDEKYQH